MRSQLANAAQTAMLTVDEIERREELETIIVRGRATFIEVGTALTEMRDSRLYRSTHATFEDYCRDEHGISRRRGYQLIEAAAAVEAVAGRPTVDEMVAEMGAALPPLPDGRKKTQVPDEESLQNEDESECEQFFTLPTRGEERRAARAMAHAAPDVPPPANESVARKLAATAREDPDRARVIWHEAVEQHGAEATAEQVAEVARRVQSNGNGLQHPEPWAADLKAVAADLRRLAGGKHPDTQQRDARRALARWRAGVYRHLDRLARLDIPEEVA